METCHYEVTRQGTAQPCDKPAVGLRICEGEFADHPPYPVCQRHFNKVKQPPLPWEDHAIARHDPATGERLEPRTAHWRPCHDHAAHFAAGLLVLSCSKCLHHGGALAECPDHAERSTP